MANTIEITTENFQAEVLDADTPVLIDFWAEWCGPCKAIAPIIDQLSEEYAGKLKVGKLDADEHQEVLQQYGVMALPTLMLFVDGQPVARIQGARPKGEILERIQPHLSS
ncbi:MAG: thioredoxin [Phototrophicales bacterium]|nr:MAG: thioredoxin [Phototrophicales bacterium]